MASSQLPSGHHLQFFTLEAKEVADRAEDVSDVERTGLGRNGGVGSGRGLAGEETLGLGASDEVVNFLTLQSEEVANVLEDISNAECTRLVGGGSLAGEESLGFGTSDEVVHFLPLKTKEVADGVEDIANVEGTGLVLADVRQRLVSAGEDISNGARSVWISDRLYSGVG